MYEHLEFPIQKPNFTAEFDGRLINMKTFRLLGMALIGNYSGYFLGIVFSSTCNLAIASRVLYLDI